MGKEASNKRPLWIVRKYKKGDEQGILKLLRSIGIARADEEWYWEFRDNPFGHLFRSWCYVGEYNGKIVGHLAYTPTLMKIGERNGIGCQTVDVAVHPKLRHQGMFLSIHKTMLTRADEEGIDIIYGFPNSPSGHLRVGGPTTHVVCKVPQLIKFVNLNETLSIILRGKRFRGTPKILRTVVKTLSRISIAFNTFYSKAFNRLSINCSEENFEIRAITSFDERIDDFWKRVSKNYDIVVVRNRKYLNWRYFKKPSTKYTVLIGEKNKKILGYIVILCRNEEKLKTGYIVDIFASSEAVVKCLVSKAIEHLNKENVDSIRCFILRNRACYKILRSYDFIPIGSAWFVARTRPHARPSLSETFVADYTKWYVTMGDTDFV